MTKTLKYAIMMTLVACAALAGAIHTWASGDTLTSADLNANFQHIHNLMVGGHGARLVDADVNASANITTTKLAAAPFIPKAYAMLGALACVGSPCTMTMSKNVTSWTRTSAGVYVINLTSPLTDQSYVVQVTGAARPAANLQVCVWNGFDTVSKIDVNCFDSAGAAVDVPAISVVVYNDN